MIVRAQHLRPRPALRRVATDPVWRRWTLAWLGGSVIGVANGATRELVYADRLGDLAAHQVSTATALALFAAYFWALAGRWPIPTVRHALAVGGTWVALTVLFELGFGHWVDGQSWAELARQYDVTAGHVWIVVLAWLGVGPAAMRALRLRRG